MSSGHYRCRMEWVVRPAVTADAEALGRVHVTSWRETYADVLSAKFLADLSIDGRARMWRRGLDRARPDRPVWVAEAGGEVIGFSMAGPAHDPESPRELELFMIYLLAQHHGSGLGQRLLDTAIGDLPALLWVAETNPRAQAFYRRNGFESDGARKTEETWEHLVEIRMTR